jgi:hypothetical protein
LDGIAFSWWNDKDGNDKFFWAGANTDVHTCQCGIDGNCVESFMKCNCDSTAPEQLVDSGKMFSIQTLKIKRFQLDMIEMQESLMIRRSCPSPD